MSRSDLALDPRLSHEPRSIPRVTYGITAGLLGAATIAVLLLAWDIVQGRPLFTPNALGAALFARESLAPDAALTWPFVLGYTAVHAGLWVGLGLLASAILETLPSLQRGPARTIGLAIGLFASIEAIFLVFSEVFLVPGLRMQIGAGPVALANASAAALMAGYLSSKRWRRPSSR